MSADETTYWRGAFNQWQLGLGGHVNIQHYARALDEARQAAATGAGLPPQHLREIGQVVRPTVERMDFRKELVAGDAVVLSAIMSGAPDGQVALNGGLRLVDREATAMRFDSRFTLFDLTTASFLPWPGETQPAADALRAMRPLVEPWVPDAPPANAEIGWLGTVEVNDCDPNGLQSARGLFDIITRGLWAVQIRRGRHRDRMAEIGLSGGVTALQVRHGTPARMGDLLEVRMMLLGLGAHSVRMGQWIGDATSGRTVARVEYVTTFFNRATGRKHAPDADFVEALLPLSLAR